jgi:hypothetical protein
MPVVQAKRVASAETLPVSALDTFFAWTRGWENEGLGHFEDS